MQGEQLTNIDIRHGDCLEVLRDLPDNSVNSVVTSPPYAMQRKSTYGGIQEKDYPEWTVAWMREVWRVLKDDGSVIINISSHVKNGELSDYVLRTRLALREDGWAEPGVSHRVQGSRRRAIAGSPNHSSPCSACP